jgi:hypothetical protein
MNRARQEQERITEMFGGATTKCGPSTERPDSVAHTHCGTHTERGSIQWARRWVYNNVSCGIPTFD